MELIKPSIQLLVPSGNSLSALTQIDKLKIVSFLHQPSFSDSTKENYARIIRKFFEFYSKYSLKDITDIHLSLYLKSLDKKPNTKNLILKALSSLYSYLVHTDYLVKNPLSKIKPEKALDNFRSKLLSFEQIDRMMSLEENARNKLLLLILYYGGLRVSEAIQLKGNSFRAAESGGSYMTVIGKGRKIRSVFLPEDLCKQVLKYMQLEEVGDEDFLFYSIDKAQMISRMQAFRIIKKAAKGAKIHPLPSPHWFRHSSATHAIEAGAPIHVVQHALGHASVSTTGKYLHANPTLSNANYLKRTGIEPTE